ncbi:UNVERIFIED_CONTAM: twitching motility protein PilT [Euhalothece sp. KZN 001]
MRLLLDTHTFIWFVTDSPQISITAKTLIEDEYNQKLLSIGSIWEMAIKHSLGKLSFKLPFMSFITSQMQQNSMELLNIQVEYLNVVASLPLHHRDPFDRLIIAQAMVEQIPVVGRDKAFDSYSVQRLW